MARQVIETFEIGCITVAIGPAISKDGGLIARTSCPTHGYLASLGFWTGSCSRSAQSSPGMGG